MDIISVGGKGRDPLWQSEEYWEYLYHRGDYNTGCVDGRLQGGKVNIDGRDTIQIRYHTDNISDYTDTDIILLYR